uniref:Uncharacterized protein n=1 Tax=Chelonoidis abingdonii TaxID=106734 RepID=A0A8C0JDP8_CHEAB
MLLQKPPQVPAHSPRGSAVFLAIRSSIMALPQKLSQCKKFIPEKSTRHLIAQQGTEQHEELYTLGVAYTSLVLILLPPTRILGSLVPPRVTPNLSLGDSQDPEPLGLPISTGKQAPPPCLLVICSPASLPG